MDSHIGGPAITLHGPLKQEHRSMLTLFEYYIALDIACFFLCCRLLPDTKGIFGVKNMIKIFLLVSIFLTQFLLLISTFCYISFLPFFLLQSFYSYSSSLSLSWEFYIIIQLLLTVRKAEDAHYNWATTYPSSPFLSPTQLTIHVCLLTYIVLLARYTV